MVRVNFSYKVNEERIPTLKEEPVKSLGRLYRCPLNDRSKGREIQNQVQVMLDVIDNTSLSGPQKLWCYQFGILPRVSWPLTVYEVCCSRVEMIERKINTFLRRWLGAPKMLACNALYSRSGMLQLPISSVVEEYKCCKVRLALMMEFSPDGVIADNQPSVSTGRKWSAEKAAEVAVAAAQFREVLGDVRGQDKGGVGFGKPTRWWSTASAREKRELALAEVRRDEENARTIRAVQQPHQGAWMTWGDALPMKLPWNRLLRMNAQLLKFTVCSPYDVLCTPANRVRWGISTDSSCLECRAARATLEHILSSCPVALSDGRYTWRHNHVLQAITRAVSEFLRQKAIQTPSKTGMRFVKEGDKRRPCDRRVGKLLERKGRIAKDWRILTDCGGTQTVPPEICSTGLRPDIVIWSKEAKRVILAELTIPWESRIKDAFRRKSEKYICLLDQCRANGWEASFFPFEIGCRGFVGQSFLDFLKRGLHAGPRFQREIVRIAREETQLASIWVLRHHQQRAINY